MEILDNKKYFNSSEVKDFAGVSLRQLYYWELRGAVHPESFTLGSRNFRRYSEEDVLKIKKIKQYLDEGFILDKAIEKADGE